MFSVAPCAITVVPLPLSHDSADQFMVPVTLKVPAPPRVPPASINTPPAPEAWAVSVTSISPPPIQRADEVWRVRRDTNPAE